MIRLYDTLTATKREFVPLEPGRVRIYVCGPTVYEVAHVGHARCYVAWDVIVRFLRRHHDVTFVRNVTDVDDKIIARAAEQGVDPGELARRCTDLFLADMDALGVARPDVEPRVTGHIPQIVAMIARLIGTGHAYAAGGDVYYAVRSFEGYGKLSKRSIDELEAGARVEPGEHKRDPLDFALWKAAKPGEPRWESPWGPGRPGWHIECSAMNAAHLGPTIDIHGGGKDLVFPHHENEIAQSEAAHGATFARHWMHNGFLNVDDQKMSKSLGNFFTVRDVLERFDPQVLRLFLLSVHYRSPINFSDAALGEAVSRLRSLNETLARIDAAQAAAGARGRRGAAAPAAPAPDVLERFEQAMCDDFNTARALADLGEAFRECNQLLDAGADRHAPRLAALRAAIADAGGVLGLFVESPGAVLERLEARARSSGGIDPDRVEALIAERTAARAARDFARADALRAQLADMGVTIKDSPQGTTWAAS